MKKKSKTTYMQIKAACDKISRSEQKVIATRRDETTGAVITVLAGPPERLSPKAKPWCGTG